MTTAPLTIGQLQATLAAAMLDPVDPVPFDTPVAVSYDAGCAWGTIEETHREREVDPEDGQHYWIVLG